MLEPPDGLGNRRLRGTLCNGRGLEGAVLGHSQEHFHLAKIHRHPPGMFAARLRPGSAARQS
jgi:hypothetical protein